MLRTPLLLLAEADPLVADTLLAILEDAGYQVVWAPEPDAALRYLAGDKRIKLLIMDWRIPNHGRDAILVAADARGVPVVVMSGHPEDLAEPPPARLFLAKPFAWITLVSAVERGLAAVSKTELSPGPVAGRPFPCPRHAYSARTPPDLMIAPPRERRSSGPQNVALSQLGSGLPTLRSCLEPAP
jgi:CheY-like chemotaxis protein